MGEPVDALRDQVAKLFNSGIRNLAINLTGLTFVDSSGMRAMISIFTSAGECGAKCKFFGASKGVRTLLKMAKLDETLGLFPDEASALASF